MPVRDPPALAADVLVGRFKEDISRLRFARGTIAQVARLALDAAAEDELALCGQRGALGSLGSLVLLLSSTKTLAFQALSLPPRPPSCLNLHDAP